MSVGEQHYLAEDNRTGAHRISSSQQYIQIAMPHSVGTTDEAKRRLAPRQPLDAWTQPTGPFVRFEEVPVDSINRESSQSKCIRIHTTQQSTDGGNDVATARNFVDNVPRRESAAFACPWGDDLPTEPTVLTGCCDEWPAFGNPDKQWTVPNLARRAASNNECEDEQLFSVDGGPGFARESYGEGRVTMPEYARYCHNHADGDAVPLYVFDHRCLRPRTAHGGIGQVDISSTASQIDASLNLFDDYRIPQSFERDVMSGLTGTRFRPLPPAWLLVGCARSGTPLHDHPLTVAWNALLSGCKLWAILPPDIDETMLLLNTKKVGETMNRSFFAGDEHGRNGDALAATSTKEDDSIHYDDETNKKEEEGGGGGDDDDDDDFDLSALDWFGRLHSANVSEETLSQMRVCIQRPGEVVFVPAGWWHVVLNVTDSVRYLILFACSFVFFSVVAWSQLSLMCAC